MNNISLVGILTIIATFLIEVSPAGGMFAKLRVRQTQSPNYHAIPLVNKQQT